VNFGVAYGIEAKGLFVQFDQEVPGKWTEKACADFIARHRAIYPEIPAYTKDQSAYARRYGHVKDLAGRQRLIPEVKSARASKRNEGERFCGNFPIQSGAQSIMKMAMRDINRRREGGDWLLLQGLPLLQVHDALYFEVRRSAAPEYAAYAQMIMENQVSLVVPTPVDVKLGPRLGNLAAELEEG
jgi:DNA polymerase I-like protein with 3'-5' exonuclease and polymerase domains